MLQVFTSYWRKDQNIDKFNVVCPEMSLYFSWRPDGIHVGRSGVVNGDGDSKKIIIKVLQKDNGITCWQILIGQMKKTMEK